MESSNPDQSPKSGLPVPQVTEPVLPVATAARGKFRSLAVITRVVQGLYWLLLGVTLAVAGLCFQSCGLITELDDLHSDRGHGPRRAGGSSDHAAACGT